ncbi:MAG: membrane protein [Lysobacteraceae bacterium]|nr:MAG: membrane protein [Xanthomonadaceae bacterium]
MDWMQATWFWWALACALLALEALVPGAFMLWFGLAAIAMGLIKLVLPELALSTQWGLFGLLALLSAGLGRRWRARHPVTESDQPMLNRRAEQLRGRVFPLETEIRNGRGRIKVGDAFWTVEGEDAPAGSRVRVVAVEGLTLRVQRVDD